MQFSRHRCKYSEWMVVGNVTLTQRCYVLYCLVSHTPMYLITMSLQPKHYGWLSIGINITCEQNHCALAIYFTNWPRIINGNVILESEKQQLLIHNMASKNSHKNLQHIWFISQQSIQLDNVAACQESYRLRESRTTTTAKQ